MTSNNNKHVTPQNPLGVEGFVPFNRDSQLEQEKRGGVTLREAALLDLLRSVKLSQNAKMNIANNAVKGSKKNNTNSSNSQQKQQQQNKDASPLKSSVTVVANGSNLKKEEGIVKEFNVTGNKLVPVSSSTANDSNAKHSSSSGAVGNTSSSSLNDNTSNSKKRSAPQPTLLGDDLDGNSDNDDDSYNSDDEDEDYDDDDDDPVIGNCLHCNLPPPPSSSSKNNNNVTSSGPTSPGIQVSCDDCHSFICSDCHWCHEYQANHEIRVCDRCDAFYCKTCDEMDQCEDCGEVVCGGCGALCSCKFCGCGLCEDCATACGRCGIVLCARDAKFAVECDTCKMSYCLVCLASGTKDPCVRCGHRTSKRVEQLVHLRLKSIYKAFKQSGAALGNNGKGNDNHDNTGDGSGRRNNSSDYGNSDHSRNSRRGGDVHSSSSSDPNNRNWISKKSGNGPTSVSMPLPASVQRYAEIHGKDLKKRPSSSHRNGRQNLKGDVGAVLQVAAAAASATAAASSSEGRSRHGKGSNSDYFSDCPSKMSDPDLDIDGGQSDFNGRNTLSNDSDRFASRTQAEADAAAAALLAELDEEKMQNEASNKAKKSKKKKKKERQAAKEKEKEEMRSKVDAVKPKDWTLEYDADQIKGDKEVVTINKIDQEKVQVHTKNNSSKKKKRKDEYHNISTSSLKHSLQSTESIDNESEDDEIARLAEVSSSIPSNNDTVKNRDETEKLLADLVSANDLEGIENLLAELKGVPGRAAVRKNAKKAVKRIKEEQMTNETTAELEQQSQYLNKSNHDFSSDIANTENEGNFAYKAPEPLLKIVSRNSRVAVPGQTPRYECVMHMAPNVVGWVIGKGGQRIRDLMEESGAKVWIDQDSMGPNDMRVVYVSGNKKSTDVAVTMVKDLVAKAPVGGTTTHGISAPTTVHTMNDTSSVTSTRSSLTSTPVSLVQHFTQQAPPMAEKPSFSPVRKAAQNLVNHNIAPKSPNLNANIPASGDSSSVANTPMKPSLLPVPPPGILGVSEVHAQNASSPLSNVNEQQYKPIGARMVHELTCEARFVPLLIGRRGWTVKQIQDESGARVDIDQTVSPRRITISGEADQVHAAVRLVRGVLSYPHAKQHYNAPDGLDESSVSESMMRPSNSDSVNVLKEIPSSGPSASEALYPFMYLNNDEHIPTIEMNQSLPSTTQSSSCGFSQPPVNQSDDRMSHHQQPVRMGLGLNMFHRTSSVSSQAQLQMEMDQPAALHRGSNLKETDSHPDQLYSCGQQETTSGVGHGLEASSKTRDFRNRQTLSDTFQYDTVLPLPQRHMQMSGMNPHEGNQTPFTGLMDPNRPLNQGIPYGVAANQSTVSKNPHRVTNERDAVNSMFGSKVDDSLLSSFNNFSFGVQESESDLGSNFFDFLSHDTGDTNDKPTEERSFGLGGVRLDVSYDNNTPIDSEHSGPLYDHSKWGPQ